MGQHRMGQLVYLCWVRCKQFLKVLETAKSVCFFYFLITQILLHISVPYLIPSLMPFTPFVRGFTYVSIWRGFLYPSTPKSVLSRNLCSTWIALFLWWQEFGIFTAFSLSYFNLDTYCWPRAVLLKLKKIIFANITKLQSIHWYLFMFLQTL